ncbi:DUF2975 domain-containing protein [Micromonospora sp. BRA006-A]|nr:DUF2975 domain-containing protein [Micromonospora sp. BRA006-A]
MTPLRAFLVLLFAILVLFQTMSLPGSSRTWRARTGHGVPAVAATAVTIFWVLCVQVVIVCTWHLLTLVKRDRIFTEASLGWVDGIVWAVAAAWVVLVGVFGYVGFNADDPGLPLLLFLLVTGVSVLGLLMVVLRALLRQATTLRTDMEAVI